MGKRRFGQAGTAIYGLMGPDRPTGKFLLGRSFPTKIPDASEVFVKRLDWDEWLKMYFPKMVPYIAHDPNKICKSGDFVLIEHLPEKLTRDITHKVLKVVYPCGDVTDPITGKKCVAGEYRDEMEWKDRLWGKNEKAFNYDKAPPRGWQEGKKDWSHKPAFKKWHEFIDRDQTEAEY